MNPILAVELLFFAIFGQTTHEHFKIEKRQPEWTTVLFKLAFGIYMLVSVVVLINLLIAMMSDTYQSIQAQSDIEWKYGLSKLIRNMHRTTTAPSPLNLLTTWIAYFYKLCKKRVVKPKRPSVVHMMGFPRPGRMSPRSTMGTKWLSKVKKGQVAHKDSIALSAVHLSPMGSQLSFRNVVRIDDVVDWDTVRRKYRELVGEEADKPSEEVTHPLETDPLTALTVSSTTNRPLETNQVLVNVSPITIIENLFFAIFGQKSIEDFAGFRDSNKQPEWTLYLFKVSFSLYMLVTVIVLINLLIAMMSDTYQSITSQSDLQWKYGLSKLIRNMQKTSTAPSPLNLFSAWSLYLFEVCKKRMNLEERAKRRYAPRFLGRHFNQWLSTHRDSRVGPLHKNNIDVTRLREDTASQFEFDQSTKIANIIDWTVVSHKYRVLFGDEIEKPSSEEMDEDMDTS